MTLDDVGAYLVTQSIGVLGTTLFLGMMPPVLASTDPLMVAVHEYGGRTAAGYVRPFGAAAVDREYTRLQIEVRGLPEDYTGPRQKAQDCYLAMSKLMSFTFASGAACYTAVPLQPPFARELDGSKRWVIVFNVELYKAVTLT